MIGYAILNGRGNHCCIQGKGLYAIYFTRTYAEEHAKNLSEVTDSKYEAKNVNIEVLE